MKKRTFFSMMFVAVAMSFSINAQSIDPGEPSLKCTVSSDPEQNWGHCVPALSGEGDWCLDFNFGPACDGVVQIGG